MEENIKIKILLVGDTTWPMYVNAFYGASKGIAEAKVFDFGVLNSGRIGNNLFLRVENKLSFGIFVLAKNIELLQFIKKNEYKHVFFYSSRIISWRIIKKLKKRDITVAIYCNDNPFSDYYPRYFWRNIRKSAKFSDITYSYRKGDIDKYKIHGAVNVKLLRGYYNENRSYKIANLDSSFYVPKVIFLGHFENDERGEYLNALIESNIEIGIRKTDEWKRYAKDRKNIYFFEETVERYNEILNKAEIAIVFLSKINKDTYTRRCFEIPATGTLMLAPYNEDLSGLFKENEEIIFYRNKEEFCTKVKYYLSHPDEAKRIGEGGRKRVLEDGHSAKDRLKQIVNEMLAI